MPILGTTRMNLHAHAAALHFYQSSAAHRVTQESLDTLSPHTALASSASSSSVSQLSSSSSPSSASSSSSLSSASSTPSSTPTSSPSAVPSPLFGPSTRYATLPLPARSSSLSVSGSEQTATVSHQTSADTDHHHYAPSTSSSSSSSSSNSSASHRFSHNNHMTVIVPNSMGALSTSSHLMNFQEFTEAQTLKTHHATQELPQSAHLFGAQPSSTASDAPPSFSTRAFSASPYSSSSQPPSVVPNLPSPGHFILAQSVPVSVITYHQPQQQPNASPTRRSYTPSPFSSPSPSPTSSSSPSSKLIATSASIFQHSPHAHNGRLSQSEIDQILALGGSASSSSSSSSASSSSSSSSSSASSTSSSSSSYSTSPMIPQTSPISFKNAFTPAAFKMDLGSSFSHIRNSPAPSPTRSSAYALSPLPSSMHHSSSAGLLTAIPQSLHAALANTEPSSLNASTHPSPSSTSHFSSASSPSSFSTARTELRSSSSNSAMDDSPFGTPSPSLNASRYSVSSNSSEDLSPSSSSSIFHTSPLHAPMAVPEIPDWLAQASSIAGELSNPATVFSQLLVLILTQAGGDEIKLLVTADPSDSPSFSSSSTSSSSPTPRWRTLLSHAAAQHQPRLPRSPDQHEMLYDSGLNASNTQIDVPCSMLDFVAESRTMIHYTLPQLMENPELRADPYFTAFRTRPHALMAVPLLSMNRVCGVLFLTSSTNVDAFMLACVPFIRLLGAHLMALLHQHGPQSPAAELDRLRAENAQLRAAMTGAHLPIPLPATPERVAAPLATPPSSPLELSKKRATMKQPHSSSFSSFTSSSFSSSFPSSSSSTSLSTLQQRDRDRERASHFHQQPFIPMLKDDEADVAVPVPTPVRRSLNLHAHSSESSLSSSPSSSSFASALAESIASHPHTHSHSHTHVHSHSIHQHPVTVSHSQAHPLNQRLAARSRRAKDGLLTSIQVNAALRSSASTSSFVTLAPLLAAPATSSSASSTSSLSPASSATNLSALEQKDTEMSDGRRL